LSPIDLSGISALQNVGAGTNVTFRIVNWGGTSSSGTWYIFDVATNSAPDIVVQGAVSPAVVPVPDLAIAITHAGSFTQGDTADTYTIIVTNLGTAATVGQVSVADVLPAELTANDLGGSGWVANLANLTCTRSDALPAGASYPPITVTVNISAGAPASVTNIATVSGGGDLSPANNTAGDPTIIDVATAPTVATDAATAAGTTTATLNGTVNPNSQAASVHFDYGLTASYGSTASMSGTVAGAAAQAVSANITGLAAGTLYHFRAAATNVLGLVTGIDQTFATTAAPVPDLAIAATHSGDFTQGDTADTYTIMITNVGTAASSGTVTVVDTLPTDLTVTAISGSGWTADLGTLTCTRSDALAAGTSYPPITVTVSVSANAPASLTNTAVVSGGGDDVSLGNNTISDPTTILPAAAPMVSTEVASVVGCNAATLNGYVNPNGQPAMAQFQYGLTASYGSVLTVPDRLSGTTTQAVATSLSELLPGTTYHFRLAATNVLGATSGQDQVFTTLAPVEAWRLQWFGTTANDGAAADNCITTSDGMPNLVKYALGLNPLVATNNPVAADIRTGYLRLTLSKNPQATDVSFVVQVKSDLTADWTTNGTTIDANTATLLQVHDNLPVASSPGSFIRLRVSRP
jgi:uncharacterized repeat protein (TIGR01451 family)